MTANDNLHPCIADIIDAIVNPPQAIRDAERDLLASMRAERAGPEDQIVQALDRFRTGLNPAVKS